MDKNYKKINKSLTKSLQFIGVKITPTSRFILGLFTIGILFLFTFISIELQPSKYTNPTSQVFSEISEVKTVKVTRVVDGDTIEVEDGTNKFKIRLIGIDTPETVHPNKQVECFGIEAKNKTIELIEGKEIQFSFDNTQSEQDRYGRVLAYIWRAEDNIFINEYLINEGFAKLYETTTPFYFRDRFYNLEQKAKIAEKGLWRDICNY